MATTAEQLKGVRPHVLNSGLIIAAQFAVSTVNGLGVRKGASDHPSGTAIDFMCAFETGNRITEFLLVPDNWKYHNVKYIIWYQKYYDKPGAPGRMMEDRGNNTENHKDHVHVSYSALGVAPDATTGLQKVGDAASDAVRGITDVLDVLKKLMAAVSFLTDPNNWWRVALFVLGAVVVIVGLLKLNLPVVDKTLKAAKSAARKVVKK